MSKKVIWLTVNCLLLAALLLASCTPAVTEEEDIVKAADIIADVLLRIKEPSEVKSTVHTWVKGLSGMRFVEL